MACCCRCRGDHSGFLTSRGKAVNSPPASKGAKCCVAVFNVIVAPFLFLWHALTIYCLPCIGAYIEKCCCRLCAKVCCSCCFLYTDKSFPPAPASLGTFEAMQGDTIRPGHPHKKCCRATRTRGGDVKWVRATEFVQPHAARVDGARAARPSGAAGGAAGEPAAEPARRHALLFDKSVDAADICQGRLGDCWLLSACACLAEHRGHIEQLFVTKQYSHRGKYTVKLFDSAQDEWRHITVDDHFPVHRVTGRALFAEARKQEIWVPVLEKAYAKMLGSYGNLEHGHSLAALRALTGDEVLLFNATSTSAWERVDMVPNPTPGKPHDVKFLTQHDTYSLDKFFTILREYNKRGVVLGAGTRGNDDTRFTGGRVAEAQQGLVPGHSYSILNIVQSGNYRMLQLRNPWGSFEWTGAWSDTSSMWEDHADVAKACKQSSSADANDGSFWIEFSDFCRHFDQVNVALLGRGIDDLRLNLKEEKGCIGPTIGCIEGCACYCCCFRGCRYLCCGRRSSKTLVLDHVKADSGPGAGAGAAAGGGRGVSAV